MPALATCSSFLGGAASSGSRRLFRAANGLSICSQSSPYTKTNGQLIANKILQGFFGESLCEISVPDIYFTHERGQYIAIYALFLAGSNFFAPISAGFIADGQGWQWVLYWCAIFCAIGFTFLFFFMDETNYRRSSITGNRNFKVALNHLSRMSRPIPQSWMRRLPRRAGKH